MSEDSQSQPHIRRLQHSFRQNLRFEPDCNGYVITLHGEPLLMEVYTSNRVASQLLRKTLDALAFDAVTERPSKPTDVASIRRFMQSASQAPNINEPSEGWATARRGGDESVASFFTLDDELRLLQMTALNQRHKTLIGV